MPVSLWAQVEGILRLGKSGFKGLKDKVKLVYKNVKLLWITLDFSFEYSGIISYKLEVRVFPHEIFYSLKNDVLFMDKGSLLKYFSFI